MQREINALEANMKKVWMSAVAGVILGTAAMPSWAQLVASMITPVPQPWYVGETKALDIRVTNTGAPTAGTPSGTTPAPGVESIYFAFPLETDLPSLPSTCVPATTGGTYTQIIYCALPALATNATVDFNFQVMGHTAYPQATYGGGVDLRVRYEIQPTASPTFPTVTSAPGSTTEVPFYIEVPVVPPVTPTVAPVPTLGEMGLLMLGASLAALGVRRRQQKNR